MLIDAHELAKVIHTRLWPTIIGRRVRLFLQHSIEGILDSPITRWRVSEIDRPIQLPIGLPRGIVPAALGENELREPQLLEGAIEQEPARNRALHALASPPHKRMQIVSHSYSDANLTLIES